MVFIKLGIVIFRSIVYNSLKELYRTHACKEHLRIFPLLEQNCGYCPENIPQLDLVSKFLKKCSGFILKPVSGLLSPRDFLNGLAFRVFHSTQYVRHTSQPFYTPEPDICHELLGHVPLLADREFASFSQEIGLCSLGASDEDIKKLSTIYWFTVEFGLCKEGRGEIKAYGAGLLSSVQELKHALSDSPEKIEFNSKEVAETDYQITCMQKKYFIANSFKDAQRQIMDFAIHMDKSFLVRFDPYTQSVILLDDRYQIINLMENIKTNLDIATSALVKINRA